MNYTIIRDKNKLATGQIKKSPDTLEGVGARVRDTARRLPVSAAVRQGLPLGAGADVQGFDGE